MKLIIESNAATVKEGDLLPTHVRPSLAKVLCPFHTEHTPSCIIDIDTHRFHCFGCGVSGRVDVTG